VDESVLEIHYSIEGLYRPLEASQRRKGRTFLFSEFHKNSETIKKLSFLDKK
jgi:hypothetical protein